MTKTLNLKTSATRKLKSSRRTRNQSSNESKSITSMILKTSISTRTKNWKICKKIWWNKRRNKKFWKNSKSAANHQNCLLDSLSGSNLLLPTSLQRTHLDNRKLKMLRLKLNFRKWILLILNLKIRSKISCDQIDELFIYNL